MIRPRGSIAQCMGAQRSPGPNVWPPCGPLPAGQAQEAWFEEAWPPAWVQEAWSPDAWSQDAWSPQAWPGWSPSAPAVQSFPRPVRPIRPVGPPSAVAAASFDPLPRVETPSLEGFSLPRVAVFDLDETCWNHFGLDHKPPFKPPFSWCDEKRTVIDSGGKVVKMFPDLAAVILALHEAGVVLAVASHDTKPAWCSEVMDCFHLNDDGLTWGSLIPNELRIINCSSKYWPGKQNHLRDIIAAIPGGPCEFSDLLVFDDSKSVCKQAISLGAKAVRCNGGISVHRLFEGLAYFGSAHGRGVKRAFGDS